MKGAPKNVAASVRDRLLELAKENGEDFTYVLTRYALERLLVRLASSKHKDTFVLKGAMLFRVWSPKVHRPTKDLDLLGSGEPDPDRVAGIFAEIASVTVHDDGIVFGPETAKGTRIKEDAEYEGVRVNINASVGTARLELQIDIGFGDVVTPGTIDVDYPTLLPMAAPKLRAYPKETVVAEKVQAMVFLGIANSRMKDFFDVWFLATNFEFEGAVLSRAIQATFERRKTDLPMIAPVALTKGFSEDDAKMKQWKAFVSKAALLPKTTALDEIVQAIAAFVLPPLEAARDGGSFKATWKPKGPWS
jgi:predicted nucleotidyltransferase component of viral defense system